MQRYKLLHRTRYQFSAPVRLDPHTLMLRPRESHELRIESSRLEITPPATLHWHRDAEDNSVAIARFDCATDSLALESEVIIQHYNETPLDFLVADYAAKYPFAYSAEDQVMLSPCMQLAGHAPAQGLRDWVANIWRPGDRVESYTLLSQLCVQIHRGLTYRMREQPGVRPAVETLRLGTGSCRDFAFLFMEAARYLGLAARFVSGYLYAPGLDATGGSTHAWAEVYLPGAGWKGFDPTIGQLAGAGHIPVAVSRFPESVPPVAGSFVGPPGASLNVGVWVTAV